MFPAIAILRSPTTQREKGTTWISGPRYGFRPRQAIRLDDNLTTSKPSVQHPVNDRLRNLRMNGQPRVLLFGWWNLHDFAHYDATRSSANRWPKQHADYEAKRDRILQALREVFGLE